MKALLIALGLAALTTTSAWACSCNPVTPAGNYCNADAVFSGVVTFIAVSNGERIVAVQVTNVWKGSAAGIVMVHTPETEAVCGIETFGIGEEWLFYAYNTVGGDYYTSYCDRTQAFPIHPDDAAFLASPDCSLTIDPETWGQVKAVYR